MVVPAKTSSWPRPWIAAYRAMHAPFAVFGTARHYRAPLEAGEITVVCVGREARFRRLRSRLFAGRERLESTTARQPLWTPDRAWSDGAALVAVEVHPLFARRFRADGWLICPEFVRWRGWLSEMPPANPGRSVKLDLTRPRRRGYTLEQADGSKRDWDEFRREMLIPYAAMRFEQRVTLPVPLLLRVLEKSGTLLFLRKGSQRVAGQAVLRNSDQLWLAALGVKDGDLALLREGVLAGIYALTLEWARAQGAREIDAGRSPAFARDGLAQYKRKWGMRPTREPFSHLVALRVDRSVAALRNAIEREPFWLQPDGSDELEIYPA